MKLTTCSFGLSLLVSLPACGRVTMAAPDDVDAAPPDASVTVDAGSPADATSLGDASLDAGGCPTLSFAELPLRGDIGETALLPPLGTFAAQSCDELTCAGEQLYVGDLGLGVEGSGIGGDAFAGLQRVTLQLDRPARVSYRVHEGRDYNDDPGIHHHVIARLAGVEVADMVIDAREYVMPPMPTADEIVWSAIVVAAEPRSFADSVTLDWVSACPVDPPLPRARQSTRAPGQ